MRLHAARLDVGDGELARLRATLSVDERRRADAFSGERERRRFVADHGHRRSVLGAATEREPAAIGYVVGADGKPGLRGGGPHFSASRTSGVALYAICDAAPVGVDVEVVDPEGGHGRLAERVLAPGERAAYEATAAAGRPAALAACWTRQEAYGKALGTGLVFPLDAIELWAGDDRPVRCGDVIVHSVDLASSSGPWVVDGGAALAAAVAVRTDADVVSIVPPSPTADPPAR